MGQGYQVSVQHPSSVEVRMVIPIFLSFFIHFFFFFFSSVGPCCPSHLGPVGEVGEEEQGRRRPVRWSLRSDL